MIEEDEYKAKWLRQSAWIYPEDDEKIIPKLKEAFKTNSFPHCEIWQLIQLAHRG